MAIGSRYRSRLPWLTAGWLIVGVLDQKYVAKTCAWSLLLQHLSASTKINRFHPQKITADIDKTQYDVLQSSAVYKVPTLLVLAFARYTVRTCHHVKHVLVWLIPCCNVQMLLLSCSCRLVCNNTFGIDTKLYSWRPQHLEFTCAQFIGCLVSSHQDNRFAQKAFFIEVVWFPSAFYPALTIRTMLLGPNFASASSLVLVILESFAWLGTWLLKCSVSSPVQRLGTSNLGCIWQQHGTWRSIFLLGITLETRNSHNGTHCMGI